VAFVSTPSLDRWSPALRRAVMRVRPEYFTWPLARRERYGVACPKKDEERLHQALCIALFGSKKKGRRGAATGAERLTLEEQHLFNQAILPLSGIGEDSFYLNEMLPKRKTLLSFQSLRDFDEQDYRFQEAARKEEDPNYLSKPYRGSLYLSWARLFVDEDFTYATLSMAAGYLYAHLNEITSDLIAAQIPHRHVPGNNHGKRERDGWQWDMKVDAGGKEALLAELQQQTYAYQNARHEELLNAWHEKDLAGVYLVDTSVPNERNLHIVFSNLRALEAVRFRSFLRDCRALERPANELAQAEQEETHTLARFIEDKHQELLRSFDPKVVPLRKRRRIIMHKNAFDDLE
jgi:hypothetical protein